MRYQQPVRRVRPQRACVTRMVVDGWRWTGREGDGQVVYEHSQGWTAQPVLLSVFDEGHRFVGTVGGVKELP
jgi:hypothetical protein